MEPNQARLRRDTRDPPFIDHLRVNRSTMKLAVITPNDTERRHFWVQEIGRLSGNFGDDADRLQDQLSDDVSEGGIARLLGHLRLCGVILEEFGHDSSEEKMYSKYTDIVIHEAFKAIGLTSAVLQERSG